LTHKADETRSVQEFRADTDSASISGYAASFLTVDSFLSTFGRSAFKKTLNERGSEIPVLFNHDSGQIIGKTTELRTDSKGLKFKAMVVEQTRAGADVMALIRAEVLTGMSFGFRTIKDRSGTEADKIDLTGAPKGTRAEEVRFIEEVALKEISPVPFPSNQRPKITQFRSESSAEELMEEILDTLRSAELTPEQLEHITNEIRSLRDTTIEEPPVGTLDDEVRRQMEHMNTDIDIDLLLSEIDLL
jgi:HK97 family phage prohead protease